MRAFLRYMPTRSSFVIYTLAKSHALSGALPRVHESYVQRCVVISRPARSGAFDDDGSIETPGTNDALRNARAIIWPRIFILPPAPLEYPPPQGLRRMILNRWPILRGSFHSLYVTVNMQGPEN